MTSVLALPSPSVMLNDRGGPVPPQDVLRALQRLDPALSLRWIASFEHSTFAVTWEWKPSDPRWARVQAQDIPREAAYDIIGYLPVGCSLLEAKSYIEAHLKNYPIEEVSRVRANIAHWNDVEVPQQQIAQMIGETSDEVSRQSRAPVGQIVSSGKHTKHRRRA